MKRALITGITGQDGSYLAEFLLDKGYDVYGIVRRSSIEKYDRISHIQDKVTLVHGDLTDQSSLDEATKTIQPDEVYNLASQSFVPTSWNQPVLTADVTGVGVTRILEAVRRHSPEAKFYQASSSEMYGRVIETPQTENTRFHPRSPYAVAKVFAHHLTVNYRESYSLFACSGILFNHESPRRGFDFVTRKVSHGVAKIKAGLINELKMGNLDSVRDWGYAPEYVEAMWLMLQQSEPDDYVIATGKPHSIQDLLENAFGSVDLNWKDYVTFDPKFLRPAEVDLLVGDFTKARDKFGWVPKTNFASMVELMVRSDIDLLANNKR
ncbi:MAG: GDP-mannose 4,6-dehydratase [SAR202 cluster bacterium]|nr:GDP-mannose 4,6-dehydratase [SAR202 cluster bacterium]